MDAKIKIIMKVISTFIIIFSLFLVSGCQGGFFKGSADQMTTYPFRQGTEGIKMQFLEGMPPKNMFVGTDFSTGIRIKNMGAYDIHDRAEVKIVSPPDSFRFSEGNTKQFIMTGKSLYQKDGEEDILIFPLRALCYIGYGGTKATTIKKNMTAKMQAIACYYYETTASADLCIDPRKHLRQTNDKPVCNMQAISFSGGQGGPVGVITVNPTIIPRSETEATLQIKISMKKLAGKDTTIYSQDASCDEPKEQNKIDFEVSVGGQRMVCTPSQVKLKQAESTGTICNVQIQTNLDAYTTPISVNMKYKVKQGIMIPVSVEPPPGEVNCNALGGSIIS